MMVSGPGGLSMIEYVPINYPSIPNERGPLKIEFELFRQIYFVKACL
jgi:hypothetical protein